MKVGTEDKKKLMAVVVLLAVFALVLLYNFRDQIFGSASAANVPVAPIAAPQPRGGPSAPVHDPTDPRLRLDILEASRRVKYEAGGRNIFRMEAPKIVATTAPVRRDVWGPPAPPTPTPTPPPPPIPITYYGYANSKPGEPKRVFLQKQGESDVFVASLGDIVARRYKIVDIQPKTITMEDVITNNRQPITLTVK